MPSFISSRPLNNLTLCLLNPFLSPKWYVAEVINFSTQLLVASDSSSLFASIFFKPLRFGGNNNFLFASYRCSTKPKFFSFFY